MSRAQRLTVVLGLNLALVTGLVVVGIGAHSVGVLAEGGDYLLDAAGAGLALLAIRLSARQASSRRPSAYLRTTGFAALVNSGWLLVLELLVAGVAADRLATRTPEVRGLPLLIVSGIAALAMTAAAFVLRGDDSEGNERDLSVAAVLLDTVADAAAAAGVAVAGAIILAVRGWYWLDPAVALAIAVMVAYHAAKLIRKVLNRGRATATRPVLRCDQSGDDVADLIGSQRAGGVADGQFHPLHPRIGGGHGPARQEATRARFPGSRTSWPAAAPRHADRPGSRPSRPGRRR
jgi:cobalt-zinc-cadmium efflux system protein